MDLIYEGITTIRPNPLLPNRLGQNGPDLRRDYDCVHVCTLFMAGYMSEWTWFTKGLRLSLHFWWIVQVLSEWTWFTKGLRHRTWSVQNARRIVRMDLIYEGITTVDVSHRDFRGKSEWTWFTKGLRQKLGFLFLKRLPCQNGPDLRRDYDVKTIIRFMLSTQ